jgi:hypothetical protein
MVKRSYIILTALVIFFLLFSFSPTLFELSKSNNLTDKSREFILEHNYYWPDFNLYLSKIRQGWEGRWTALERYTSEPHQGSFIQIFYVWLGHLGRTFGLDPNYSYQLGRLILSPLLLIIIAAIALKLFQKSFWPILAFVITLVSDSFPQIISQSNGPIIIDRFMGWWSNIDALQRITFIPHILAGQVLSFFLLYHLTFNIKHLTSYKFIFFIILGNLTGLFFPPSLMTLDGVLLILMSIEIIKKFRNIKCSMFHVQYYLLFIAGSLPSLIYFLILTRQIPWIALITTHQLHPMPLPFDQYVLGTGPVLILGLIGSIVALFHRNNKFMPLIFWVVVTFSFAIFFSIVHEQSPLRFTQTGLFIPLGMLGTYFLFVIWEKIKNLRHQLKKIFSVCFLFFVICYLFVNLGMMAESLNWQTTWLSQLINASLPAVPYPPQTMLPKREWMDGIRWLRDNTKHSEVVVAAITAGNFIPAYAGNTVYFGQSNTVNYDQKEIEVQKFFRGDIPVNQTHIFLRQGRIKYIFDSIQEKEYSGGKDINSFYPFLKEVYRNNIVTIYSI